MMTRQQEQRETERLLYTGKTITRMGNRTKTGSQGGKHKEQKLQNKTGNRTQGENINLNTEWNTERIRVGNGVSQHETHVRVEYKHKHRDTHETQGGQNQN